MTLLVVTAGKKTADWARQPIQVGLVGRPTQITRPVVFGPDDVPRVVNADEAENDLMVAVLSALTHRRGSDVDAILKALAAALDRWICRPPSIWRSSRSLAWGTAWPLTYGER